MSGLIWFLFAVFWIGHGSGNEENLICDFFNEECMIRGAQTYHQPFIAGNEGVNECSDPLKIDVLTGNIGYDFSFAMTNASLTGLKDCRVLKLKIFSRDSGEYVYTIRCPQLIFDSNYLSNGILDGNKFNGQGTFEAIYDDIIINIHGFYGTLTGEDGFLHLVIKRFEPIIELKGKAKLNINLPNVEDSVNVAVNEYLNKNGCAFDEKLRPFTLFKILDKFVRNFNDYSLKTPLQILLSKN